jgi:hypothetical protein
MHSERLPGEHKRVCFDMMIRGFPGDTDRRMV